MAEDDGVALLGHNCSATDCQSLDFLPLQCPRCQRGFCAQHIRSHGCSPAAAGEAPRAAAAAAASRCMVAGCTQPALTGWACAHCGAMLCASHRQEEAHGCVTLLAKAAEHAENKAKHDAVAGKLQTATAAAKKASAEKLKANQPMAVRLRTMKIKGKATALAGNIRTDHMRAVLLALHTPGSDKIQRVCAGTCDGEWSVGRLIDLAAKALQQPGVDNSDPSKPRWHLFCANREDDGAALDVSKTIGDALHDGDIVVLSQVTSCAPVWCQQALKMM